MGDGDGGDGEESWVGWVEWVNRTVRPKRHVACGIVELSDPLPETGPKAEPELQEKQAEVEIEDVKRR